MKLRAQSVPDRRRDRRKFLREFVERVTEAIAQARSREEYVHTHRGAVEAVGQDAPDPIGRLVLERRALKHAIGLGQGRRAGVLRVAQMPDDASTDDRGEVYFLCQAAAVFFIRQDIRGQRQPTPRQHRDQTLLTEGTDQTVDSHGREMADNRTQFQTEAPVCGQESIASDLRSHLAIAQDEMRQDREHRFARRALDTPDGETTQPDADIMGVPGQTPASATAGHVCELKAKGEEKGEDTLDKRLAIIKQKKVGGFVPEINGDSTVFTSRFGWAWHGSPPAQMVFAAEGTPWGYCLAISSESRKAQGFTTKSGGIWIFSEVACYLLRPVTESL